MVKKSIVLYAANMTVGLFTAFVLTVLWSWFVVPAFHVDAVSFWVMYGLTMLVDLVRFQGNDSDADKKHEVVAVMLDACVPANRRDEVNEQLTTFSERMWYDAGWKVFGRLLTNVLTLGLGFVVHMLAS